MAKELEKRHPLGYFIEDLWTQGFKLSDEDIHFIYLGKNTTNAPDWMTIKALKVTLQFQLHFDGSFFISVLELLAGERVKTTNQADRLLRDKGLSVPSKPQETRPDLTGEWLR
ncbi:DUF6123 family protein [Sediminibacillus halophilus]|uniref:Uncharacterized protein n=1 Tax=Sediminibacillus halophilus TaxID=482461 RepID=A0A1G9M1M7_9BACI|nr:DUF6123 family protein [Sediminibacillus halophilus]SDL68108.1 hypothetical protein SAMN05216244_0379 [Sediminibacillus halophilus]